jgi:murein DD-endopeptidase MepM/ murein hydrolase activator NlpD
MKLIDLKGKFRYNHETLQYESVGKSVKRTIWKVVSFLLFSLLISAGLYFIYSLFFDTFAEHSIKKENKILAEHLKIINERYEKLKEEIDYISVRDTNIYSVIFESKPWRPETSADKSQIYNVIYTKSDGELIQLSSEKLSKLTTTVQQRDVIFDSLKKLAGIHGEALGNIPSIIPINNLNINAIGASVGNRIKPVKKTLEVHTGIDFAVPAGTPVRATASGRVKNVTHKRFTSGAQISIDHGNEYETRYLYLDEVFVYEGAKVKRGDIIGKVGNVGLIVPHLHYEVRIGGKVADPLNYFFMELSPEDIIAYTTASSEKGQSLD